MNHLTINQLTSENLRSKRVFVRIDVDEHYSPTTSDIDEIKLRASLPTLEYLVGVGARIVIGTHLGDPDGDVIESLRLDGVSHRLTQLLGRPVRKLDQSRGGDALLAASQLQDGDVLLLENLRFNSGEDTNDAEFARELGQLCDVYCNDAFTLAHRALASTVGITRYVPVAVAGLNLAHELTIIEAVTNEPKSPLVAIIAGTRLEDKLPIIHNLLPKIDRLFIGGTLAFKFLKAKGQGIGAATVNEAFTPLVQDFLREVRNFELILPQDFLVVNEDEFSAYEANGRQGAVPSSRRVADDEILPSDLPVDIGPSTINRIKGLLDSGNTIIWNGPLGLWEIDPFSAGTREVAKFFAERISPRHQRSIICGDSLTHAIYSFDFSLDRVPHLIPGGESALQLLAGNPLPAIAALGNQHSPASVEFTSSQILLPVDGSDHSLEAARQLARFVNTHDAQITVLHVIARESQLEHSFAANRMFAATNAALASQGLSFHRQITVEGDPAEEILKLADRMNADLIAMGSHGLTGMLRLIMGSVSKKVLDRAKCAVMIVRIPDKTMVMAGLVEK